MIDTWDFSMSFSKWPQIAAVYSWLLIFGSSEVTLISPTRGIWFWSWSQTLLHGTYKWLPLVGYFDYNTVFKVLYWRTSVKGGTLMHFRDAWISYTHTHEVFMSPTLNRSSAIKHFKHRNQCNFSPTQGILLTPHAIKVKVLISSRAPPNYDNYSTTHLAC